ncbi:MAG: hypothetical protein KME64_29225 [Scytonematopsis contorta HA4267-MV1]|nr:hypothetical protein [Scytonematopsis contorta HA4267-MV1]
MTVKCEGLIVAIITVKRQPTTDNRQQSTVNRQPSTTSCKKIIRYVTPTYVCVKLELR